jgi:glycosyltransferase involved in cell wall biosynthesis
MSIDVTEGFQKKNNFRLYEKDVSIPILRSAIENVWITIAIPTYKRGKLLKKTIDSALLQSDKYLFDIIIVDNDSQRNSETERLVRSYDDPKISYYRNTVNLGLFGNWNRCFELAKGEYVVLLHDDDFLLSDFLSESMQIVRRNPDIAIFKPSMFQWHDTGKQEFESSESRKNKFSRLHFLRVNAIDYIFMGNYMEAPTGCIFKKNIVIEYGGFNNNLFPCADTIFLLHISMEHKVIIYRKYLGVKRLSDNESTKRETLEKFVVFRYNVIKFLINKYSLNRLCGHNYIFFCIMHFLTSLKEISSDFVFPVNEFPLVKLNGRQCIYYKTIINGYKVLKALVNMVIKQVK